MLKVITMIDNQVTSKVTFNERRDDEAFNKALVECDRAVWSIGDETKNFIIALMKDDRILRYRVNDTWKFPSNSIYNID